MTKNRTIAFAGALALVLVLGACSSSKDAAPTDSAAKDSVPEVVIDEQLQGQLNVEPGSAIIPGSIESVAQELNEECTTAVAPLRELMKKYPSLRQVPPGDYDEPFAKAKACEEIDAQQWADFYTKELAGWIYGKTDKDGKAVTDAPATDAPATDAPATDAPATDAPATDAPATTDGN